ncbi:MAG: hypothetical protein R6U50_01130 [Desulfobacterales bacterium]
MDWIFQRTALPFDIDAEKLMFTSYAAEKGRRPVRRDGGKEKAATKPLLSAKGVALGRLLGGMVYRLDPRYKHIVKQNLQFAFPRMPDHLINRAALGVYQQFGLTLVELLKMAAISRGDILCAVKIRGREHLEKAIGQGGGFIFFSAHVGNWEMAHLFASVLIDADLALVAKKLPHKTLNTYINRLRSKFGNRVITKKGALPHMSRALRNKKIVGLLIDQETRNSEAVQVEFFNKTVNATPSAAMLARRYGCPVLPVFCVREKNFRQHVLVVRPPMNLVRTKDIHEDVRMNTQMMTDEIESIVRMYPTQWFWFHKRWKRHYPHLYQREIARNHRREKKKRAGLSKPDFLKDA